MSIEDTLAERLKTHGSFIENGRIMQALKDVARSGVNWHRLTPYQKEAIDMNMHKIGRILSGDPDCPDHWRDISGYATLVEKELTASAQPPASADTAPPLSDYRTL